MTALWCNCERSNSCNVSILMLDKSGHTWPPLPLWSTSRSQTSTIPACPKSDASTTSPSCSPYSGQRYWTMACICSNHHPRSGCYSSAASTSHHIYHHLWAIWYWLEQRVLRHINDPKQHWFTMRPSILSMILEMDMCIDSFMRYMCSPAAPVSGKNGTRSIINMTTRRPHASEHRLTLWPNFFIAGRIFYTRSIDSVVDKVCPTSWNYYGCLINGVGSTEYAALVPRNAMPSPKIDTHSSYRTTKVSSMSQESNLLFKIPLNRYRCSNRRSYRSLYIHHNDLLLFLFPWRQLPRFVNWRSPSVKRIVRISPLTSLHNSCKYNMSASHRSSSIVRAAHIPPTQLDLKNPPFHPSLTPLLDGARLGCPFFL